LRCGRPTFADAVGQFHQDHFDGPNAVVVAGNRQIDRIGVAVGVDQRDGGDTHALGFLDGDVLAVRIDDDHGVGQPVHVADALQIASDLGQLPVELGNHFFAETAD